MQVIGLAGWSGAGKTTLLTRLIPVLRRDGLSVATIKHAHHAFDIDQPGKDSFEQRRAGASQVLVASARRHALITEHHGQPEPGLPALLRLLRPCDLVIVEGFKAYAHPKIAVHRAANNKPPITRSVREVTALLTDEPVPDWTGPAAGLDDIDAAAAFFRAGARPVVEVLARLDAEGVPARVATP